MKAEKEASHWSICQSAIVTLDRHAKYLDCVSESEDLAKLLKVDGRIIQDTISLHGGLKAIAEFKIPINLGWDDITRSILILHTAGFSMQEIFMCVRASIGKVKSVIGRFGKRRKRRKK
ncbi:hypothetical protein ACFL4W_02765 [Planctomycetota bacterium]